jgi:hypothetical protein
MNKDPQLRVDSSRKIIANCIVTALVLTGCESETTQNSETSSAAASTSRSTAPSVPTAPPERVVCRFPSNLADQDQWDKIKDPPLDIPLLAGSLGVSEAAVRAGYAGPVVCEPGLALKDMPKFSGFVGVNGLPSEWGLNPECYAFFINTNDGPVATDLSVACAAVEQPGAGQTA